MASNTTPQDIIQKAITVAAEESSHSMGGKWLECLTTEAVSYIKEWDIFDC